MAGSSNNTRENTFVDLQLLSSCHEVLALQGFTASGDGNRTVQLPLNTESLNKTTIIRNPASNSATTTYYGHMQPLTGFPLVSESNLWPPTDQGQGSQPQSTTYSSSFAPTSSTTYYNYVTPAVVSKNIQAALANISDRSLLESAQNINRINETHGVNPFRKPVLQNSSASVFDQLPKISDERCIVCQNSVTNAEYSNQQGTRESMAMNGLEVTITSRPPDNDPMMNRTGQDSFVSLKRLTDLLGIPTETLQGGTMLTNLSRLEEVSPAFCQKCLKLASLADMLEKKLKETTSILLQSIPLYSNTNNFTAANYTDGSSVVFSDEISLDSPVTAGDTIEIEVEKTAKPGRRNTPKKRTNSKAAKSPPHDPSKPHSFLCEQCGQGFETVNVFATHYKKFHPELKFPEKFVKEKPFVCEECDASFATRGYLTVHQKIHSNERNFKCTLCERNFVRKLDFDMHMNRHNGKCIWTQPKLLATDH